MDIAKLNSAGKASLCKKYFFIGLALLPLVWLTNFVWFFREAFCRPKSASQTSISIRMYVILSGLGCLCWIGVLVAWETYFQSYRSTGAVWADQLSFTFALGKI